MDRKIYTTENEIDLFELLIVLWKHAWIIALATVVCAAAGFFAAGHRFVPIYSSSAWFYVNNQTEALSENANTGSYTTAVGAARQRLVDVYGVILSAPSTLREILEETGLQMSTSQLNGMISVSEVNETEVMAITARSSDPEVAKRIVDAIVKILPGRIEEIVLQTSARLVSSPELPTSHTVPPRRRYTAIGAVVGFALSCGVFVVLHLLDDTVHDRTFLEENTDYPLLGAIPDMRRKSGGYGYRYGYRQTE